MAARLRDVAELAGVSVKTVSNVVNGYPHVSVAMRRRVQAALDEVGYRPNVTARSLRTGRTGLIGLAVPRLHDPYFSELADAVVTAAADRGWTVLVEQTGGDPQREAQVLSGLRPALIDGLVFHPLAVSAAALATVERDTPLVLLGEHLDGQHPRLAVNGVAAARAMVTHLARTGRRRIACIGAQPERGSPTAAQRLAGYRAALHDEGLPVRPEHEGVVADYRRADGVEATHRLLAQRPRPDAIFCFSDLLALGALRAVHDAGLRVPGDVAVAGFDDITEARYVIPSLSTVAPDKVELASRAVRLLAARMEGAGESPHVPDIPYRLVLRESTAT